MPKKRNFDPHAAKALNKKIWYLRDQQVVAMTGQENQLAEVQEATISQKDRQPQKVKPLRTEKRKNYPDRINHSKATGSVTISPKAILGTVHHLAIKNHQEDQSHTLAGQLPEMTNLKAISGIVHHLAIKKAFRHAASRTLAGQQAAILKTGQKEHSVQAHRPAAKESLTPAVQLRAKVKKDPKGTLAEAVPAKRNHTPLHALVPPAPILAISQKEVLAQVQKDQQTKNLAKGPKADLRNAKAVFRKINRLTMRTSHNVSLLTIR